jgi:hypothetical protein
VNYLAYAGRPILGGVPRTVVAATSLLLLGAFGCTAGVHPSSSTGSGGAVTGQGGSKGGSTGTGGFLSSTGGHGDVVLTGTGGMISPDGGCMMDKLDYTVTQPTVFILVDLSGSEFDSMTTGVFFNLRPAVEQVVMTLQDQVRFGIASFVGSHENADGGSTTCHLQYAQVPPALNNYTPIFNAYQSWGPLLPFGQKADTPMFAAIQMVQATLQADTDTGPKYMMLVTDSETDFCDDGNAVCPADAITYLVQNLYNQTPSIGTLVVGIPDPSPSNQIEPQVLKNLANAGVGQGVGLPTTLNTATDMWNQCHDSMTTGMDWQNLYTAAGRTGMTSLATYTSVGSASAFEPTDTSTSNLVTQIQAAINTIPRSCVVDLSTLAKPIKVDLTKLNEGGVFLNGTPVQLDPSNTEGWDMINQNQLELFGTACTTFQNPSSPADLNFQFPCDLIIGVG